MASDIDLMADELLEDTVRRWMRRRDVEPAWRRSECAPAGRARLRRVCRESHSLEAQAMRGQPVDPIVLNNRRGACAQLVLAQRLCMGMAGTRQGAHVRSEFRTIANRRDSTRPDVLAQTTPGTTPRTVIENKHVHLPAYLAGGRLNVPALVARVQAEIAGSARQAAELTSAQRRPGLPPRMRFVFMIGGINPAAPGRAQLMQQAAQVIRQAAQQAGRYVFVADADRLRRDTMRNAARLGF